MNQPKLRNNLFSSFSSIKLTVQEMLFKIGENSRDSCQRLKSENFELIVNEESTPSSTKALSGSFGKMCSAQALCNIS